MMVAACFISSDHHDLKYFTDNLKYFTDNPHPHWMRMVPVVVVVGSFLPYLLTSYILLHVETTEGVALLSCTHQATRGAWATVL